jgi:hypothetical protein
VEFVRSGCLRVMLLLLKKIVQVRLSV